MKRLTIPSILALLAGCAAPQQAAQEANAPVPAATSHDTSAGATMCRFGPDGGPLGNNAARARPNAKRNAGLRKDNPGQPTPTRPMVADRGIGGTGAPQGSAQLAERGIGGTGIVGVITGFASVCVNGLEVAYDNSAAIDIDGVAGTPSALRVGQIVVIEAKGSLNAPVAQTISVRRQVTGRVESIDLTTGTLTIAGQPVSVPLGTWGADSVGLGDWVAVSGLRRTDGMLIASRLDLAPTGALAVRGRIIREGEMARVGQLELNGTAAAELQTGQYVLVSGQYAAGQAQIQAVAQDRFSATPDGYFGASVDHLILQAYVRVADGALYLNGLKVAAGPGVNGKPGVEGVATVSLERNADGSFTATGLRYTDQPGRSAAANHTATTSSWPALGSPPQTRHPGSAMASLAGDDHEPSSDGQHAAPTSGSATAPASATGSVAATSGSAQTPPAITPPATATTTPTRPAESGAASETLPTTPATSQLMSGNTPPSGAITAAPKASGPTHAAVAWRSAGVKGAISNSTVSLATQAVAASAATVTTPAVSPPTASRTGDVKPTGTVSEHATTGSGPSNDH